MAIASRDNQVEELASAKVTGVIKDQDGVAVPDTSIDEILMTLYEPSSGTIINGREAITALNDNEVTIDASGNLVFSVEPADNIIVGSAVAVGDVESHTAHFVWSTGGSEKTATDPFTTVDTDETVTVAQTGHGYSVGDDVLIEGADEVGGRNMNGLRIVTEVPNANSWKFEHPTAATSGATGGGSVSFWAGGVIDRQDILIPVLNMGRVANPG